MSNGSFDVRRLLHTFAGWWKVCLDLSNAACPCDLMKLCAFVDSSQLQIAWSSGHMPKLSHWNLQIDSIQKFGSWKGCIGITERMSGIAGSYYILNSNSKQHLCISNLIRDLIYPFIIQFCGKEFPSKSLEHHERNQCDERPINCKYQRIGCQWKGPVHECKSRTSETTRVWSRSVAQCISLNVNNILIM